MQSTALFTLTVRVAVSNNREVIMYPLNMLVLEITHSRNTQAIRRDVSLRNLGLDDLIVPITVIGMLNFLIVTDTLNDEFYIMKSRQWHDLNIMPMSMLKQTLKEMTRFIN